MSEVPNTPSVLLTLEDWRELAEAREPYVEFVEACLEIEARSRDPWTEIRNRLQDFKDDDLWPPRSRPV